MFKIAVRLWIAIVDVDLVCPQESCLSVARPRFIFVIARPWYLFHDVGWICWSSLCCHFALLVVLNLVISCVVRCSECHSQLICFWSSLRTLLLFWSCGIASFNCHGYAFDSHYTLLFLVAVGVAVICHSFSSGCWSLLLLGFCHGEWFPVCFSWYPLA